MNLFAAFLVVLLIPRSDSLFIPKSFKANIHPKSLVSESNDLDPIEFLEQWQPIVPEEELTNDPVPFKKFGLNLVLWRGTDRKPKIHLNRCPHAGAQFTTAGGGVVEDQKSKERCLKCAFHGLQFNDQGKCNLDPEDGNPKPFLKVPEYAAIEKDGFIWMKWGPEDSDLPEPTHLSDLKDYYAIAIKIESKGNFRFNCENLIDTDHVDFIHKNSFARIARYLFKRKKANWNINSSGVQWDNGDPGFNFAFTFPGTWTNRRQKEDAVTVMNVPVDSNSTDVYIVMYRNFGKKFWIERTLLDPLFKNLYRFVAMEDQAVIESQQDNASQMGEEGDHLCRKDDQRRRHLRAYLQGKRPFVGPLYDSPALTPVHDTCLDPT